MGGISLPYMEGGKENLRRPFLSPCTYEREDINPVAGCLRIQERGRVSKEAGGKTIPDRVGI
jgi:hypothetical protein